MSYYLNRGLLSRLYEDCRRYNSLSDELAWLCAETVLSVVTQRRYSFRAGSTQCFRIIVCPMGAGKEGYRRWVAEVLRNIDSRIIGPQYRSDQALKLGLSAEGAHSQLLLIDEIADNLSGAYDKRSPDPMQQDLITIWNELFNALPRLEGSKTAKSEIPATERPRLSILGFTTPGMFHKLMGMREFTETGLFSRFEILNIDSEDYQKWDDERESTIRPCERLLQDLKVLHEGSHGMDITDTPIPLTMDAAALRALQAYAEICKHDALHTVRAAHRGMHRRVRELTARKQAHVHALSQGRRVVMPPDVRYGIERGDLAWKRAQDAMRTYQGSPEAEAQTLMLERIRAAWQKAGCVPVYVSTLKNSYYRDEDRNEVARLLKALVLTGEVRMAGPRQKHVEPVCPEGEKLDPYLVHGDAAVHYLTEEAHSGNIQ